MPYHRAVARAVAVVLLVVAWVATWRPTLDPDVWWHIVLGDAIRRDGAIPPTDILSWWTGGEPLVAHSWAWDVIVSIAYGAAGPLGVSLVGMAVGALVVALLRGLVRVTAERRLGLVGSALAVVVAVVTVVPLWSPRAGLVDLAAVLGLTVAWSCYLRRGAAWAVWTVPLITVLWANLHGSAILAYGLCLVALAIAVPIGVRWGTWPARPWRPLVVTAGIGVLATLVNPYGPGLWTYLTDSRVASALNASLDEWRSPDFGSMGLIAMRIVLASGVLVALALRGRDRDPLVLLLAAGWTFLTLGAVRFGIIAGPLLVIALAPGTAAAIAVWTGRRPRDRGPSPAPTQPSGRTVIGLASLVIVGVIIAGTRLIEPSVQERLIVGRFPVAAVEAIRDDCTGRVFNAYDWGGYIAHAWGTPVGAYGNSPGHVVDEQASLENLRADPGPFLERNGVEILILKSASPLAQWVRASPGWETRYEDDLAIVSTRVGAEPCQRL